ncbi:unnamed protein product [Trichobilharzia regenti]|nr:unnamed protein product [Trichobilharzia regenti]
MRLLLLLFCDKYIKFYFSQGLVAHDGFLYVIGGEDGETDLTSIEKYDPATNTWALLPTNLRIGRSYAGVIIMERNAI